VVGRVAKILPTGVIVEIEDGVSGFVPISEISWNYIENPEEVLKEGEKVKVKVLDVDTENRKMRLSIKRTVENPWNKVMEELDKGSVIKGVVKKIMKSGALLEVKSYNVNAFLPSSHYEEEPKVGEEIEAMIIRILESKRGNRMIVSVKKLIEQRNYENYKKQVEAEREERTLGEMIKGR
ncbi:MAG TPA: 30S ribosomal protein S1, partial [Thermotoga sp.]|nr:30S ribosomal protein S1 [Thermotoga sp.]